MSTQHEKTKYMTLMAMFVAIHLVLEPLTKYTEMPQGGTVSFSLIAIILASYLLGPMKGLITAWVCLGAQFALGLAVFYSPASVVFDYIIPMSAVGLCSIIPIKTWNGWPVAWGIMIMMVIKTISHLISGWYAFETPLAGNLAYNLPYNIGTLIVCYALFVFLYPRLAKFLKV